MIQIGHKTAQGLSRRDFLTRLSALGSAALFTYSPLAAAEAPPETRKIRLIHAPAMCLAPQYLAEELLRAEGFTDIEYVPMRAPSGTYTPIWLSGMLAEGQADISQGAMTSYLSAMDTDGPVVVLAGTHTGCYELFGNEGVNNISALKGKVVAASRFGDERLFLSSMLAYVGVDPKKDIHWLETQSTTESMHLFVDSKVDAFLAFPPEPQILREKNIKRVILNTAIDRPWSQYFCCVVAGNKEFVQRNPIATKRALRAYLKATDICANAPEKAARYMVEKGYVADYRYALGLVTDLPYNRWRQVNPEDTLRFHALRLHEVGLIKTSAQKLIARGTDWRFLNELRKELKA